MTFASLFMGGWLGLPLLLLMYLGLVLPGIATVDLLEWLFRRL